MYFFRPFNRDPQNPWLIGENTRYSAKWAALAFLIGGFVFGGYSVFQDYSFLPGSEYTNGTFVKITGSKIVHEFNRTPRTYFYGQYRYIVSGQSYFISQMDDEPQGQPPQFDNTINVAYKKADPAKALIVYGKTLQVDARGSIVDGVALGILGYCMMYLVALPIAIIKNRRLAKSGDYQPVTPVSKDQQDLDAQTAVQRLQTLEAAKPTSPDDSGPIQPGTTS